jgi:hypothetical protein
MVTRRGLTCIYFLNNLELKPKPCFPSDLEVPINQSPGDTPAIGPLSVPSARPHPPGLAPDWVPPPAARVLYEPRRQEMT